MGTPNWADKTVWTGDNLPILRGMNSGSVDLVYLDPPFNSKADYSAPIGSAAAGAAFRDTWTLRDVDAEWINLVEARHPALYRVLLAAMTPSDKSYLVYMAVRLSRTPANPPAHGVHLLPLRSHHESLLETAHGCDLRAAELPKRSRLASLQWASEGEPILPAILRSS